MSSERGIVAGLVVYAKDIDRVAAFYAAALSLEIVERDDRFVVLSRPGSPEAGDVNIVAMPDDVAADVVIDDPPRVRHDTPLKPSFQVASLADAADAARTHGGGTKPMDSAWDFRGLRHLDGFDPEGNVVQLVESLD